MATERQIKVDQLINPGTVDGKAVLGYTYLKKIEDLNLNDEDIQILFKVTEGAKHIKKVFVCNNGEWTFTVHQYNGDFPEWKEKEGKFYSKMGLQRKLGIDPETRKQGYRLLPCPIDEWEIVAEFTVSEILEKYTELCKRKGIDYVVKPERKLFTKRDGNIPEKAITKKTPGGATFISFKD